MVEVDAGSICLLEKWNIFFLRPLIKKQRHKSVFSYEKKRHVIPSREVLLNHLSPDVIALSLGWRVGQNRQVHKHTKQNRTFLCLFRCSFPIFTFLSFLHCLQWVYHLLVNKFSDKIVTLYLIVQFIYVLLMSPDLNSAFLRGCLINLLVNPL